MKTSSSIASRPRRGKSSGAGASEPSPYVSLSDTRTLMANSLDARQQRLQSTDMISTDAAAQLTGTTRVTVNAWIAKGRAIGLTQSRRGFRLPRWQFEPACWDVMPALSKALDTTEGWALLAFLETPLGALDGMTPRQAIERGQADRALALAMAEGT